MTSLAQTVSDALALALEPSGSPARVLEGAPSTSEHILVELDGLEIGIWEVTSGAFQSRKQEVGEVMHFIAGAGWIDHADGTRTVIAPGVTLQVSAGWSGSWHVSETVRKLYTIYRDVPKLV